MELWVLAAKEILPNVIVGKYLKPEKIVIFYTDWLPSKNSAVYQEKIFTSYGIKVLKKKIPPYDYREITRILEDYVKKSDVNLKEVIFLANCSTKYTVEVIHRWLSGKSGKSHYYLPNGDVVVFGGEKLFSIRKNVLLAKDFLNAAGFDVESIGRSFDILRETQKEELFKLYKRLTEEGLFCCNGEIEILEVKKAIDREKSILGNKHQNFFKNANLANFTNSGIPLEFFTYLTLKKSAMFEEVLYNMKIISGNVRHEIDVIGVRNNKLFYFSCKKGKKIDKEHIFRVAFLSRELGGRYAVPILVLCNKSPVMVKRAREFGVCILEPKELLKLLENPQREIERWEKEEAFIPT